MRRIAWRRVAAAAGSGLSWRVFLSGLVVGVGLISPTLALGAPNGDLTLNGKATGVASTDTSTNPSPVTVSGVGRISHLGEVVVLANDFLTPHGPVPMIPYTITGTETLIVANGAQLFGTVTGTGVNNSGATSGMNVVTITGGTGGFAGATGSYTETYTGHIFSSIGPNVVGPLHTIFRGRITLGGGYCDPLQAYCDPFQRSVARDHRAGQAHHQRHQRRHRGRQ
jgi:hypothetical protein